ncbi:unnamed protein product [Adineta steineri]|uniref:Uncharacterized protein n=1 Tax=Adineta steineri TaxID=433720 RepID=A0A819LWE7_9BILA|nr:unnamed protein product [Adineta steineri]CAF0742259.1 unnamed protein product [Adineta steineri]CAF0780219.1 unnamed protein product [Adineta steineri]CAF0830320.1 unnamed protein product [Adineta steineri]CAF3970524.1 unnamed protein product [Adineta steineri]
MNSLASILYSSSSAKIKKRKNLSLQPSIKPIITMDSKASKCKVSGMLFRSSTPKTSLTTAVHPTSTSSYFSTNSPPQSPRCSTPLFSKQRRTRPFIVCELCRQRAFESLDENKNEKDHISYHRSTTSVHYQKQTSIKSHRRRSSIDQLLVWII